MILHICTRYLRGGSEARIRDMINALPDVSHHLIVGAESDLELAHEQLGLDQIDLEPLLTRDISPLSDLRCLWRLRRRITELEPSAVVTHQSKAGVLGRMAAWAAGGVPAVHSLSMASFGPGYPRHQDLVFRVLERVLASVTTAYLVVGHDLTDRFARLGIDRAKFRVVRSGVRLAEGDEDRDEVRTRLAALHRIPDRTRWVVYVGSLEERKNVHLLPRLIAELPEQGDEPPHLLVVGEGPMRERVEAESEELGVAGSVTLTGYATDAVDYLRAADVVVLLSSSEGLPQVLVQAASVGTPFVAFEVDGVRELLRLGARGTVVPQRDFAALVEVVADELAAVEERRLLDVGEWSPTVIEGAYRNFFREETGFFHIGGL